MAVMPQYRLQTLMNLRQTAKEEAERYLSECMNRLKEEQDRLKEMEKELERMIAKREAKKREYSEKAMRGDLDARGVVNSHVFIDRLKEQEVVQEEVIDGQHGVISDRQQDVEGAREDMVKATQDYKALEKHKEKWLEAVKAEIEAKEEEELDEIAQTVFLARSRQ